MNSGASEPALIGIDWGTSSLRAFLISGDGEVLERQSSSEGIMHVANREFEAVFCRIVGQWQSARTLPIVASGMITSRNGWLETPYEQLPLGAGDLARALVKHRTSCGVELHFVTGAKTEDGSAPDVMRGEETQIIGASALGMADGVFVMPGTHSKWIDVAEDRIEGCSTYMTGEVFVALKEHTILGTLMEDGPFNAEGFDLGVDAGLKSQSHLLHDLFQVRTLPLMGRIDGKMVADYLSGLLIGSEIAAEVGNRSEVSAITVIGRNDLADRYESALSTAGLASLCAPDDIVAAGHFQIARSAGLLS